MLRPGDGIFRVPYDGISTCYFGNVDLETDLYFSIRTSHLSNLTTIDMRGQKKKVSWATNSPEFTNIFKKGALRFRFRFRLLCMESLLYLFVCLLKAYPKFHRSKMREVVRVRSSLFKPQPQHVLTGSKRQYEEVRFVHVS
jgi:hypothetical protein